MVSFLFSYSFGIVFFIPGSLFNLTGCYIMGSLYGKMKGFFIAWAAVSFCVILGGFISFLLSRTFLYKQLQPHIFRYRIISALDRSFKTHGFKLIFLLRLAPVIPYNILNYAMAVTSISWNDYLFGGICGVIPHQAISIYFAIQLTDIEHLLSGHH